MFLESFFFLLKKIRILLNKDENHEDCLKDNWKDNRNKFLFVIKNSSFIYLKKKKAITFWPKNNQQKWISFDSNLTYSNLTQRMKNINNLEEVRIEGINLSQKDFALQNRDIAFKIEIILYWMSCFAIFQIFYV